MVYEQTHFNTTFFWGEKKKGMTLDETHFNTTFNKLIKVQQKQNTKKLYNKLKKGLPSQKSLN